MTSLHIYNIGPVTGHVNIDLKRFNFFIGPQSSGKSTIAKVISTLSWMEKESCTTLSEEILPPGITFKDFIEDFHRIHGYIHEDTVIEYDSEYVSINYTDSKLKITLKENSEEYKRVKVLYVPSDRNIITLPDIEVRNLESTNFRSFLFDWLDCRKHYDASHKTKLMNLGVQYYYDKSSSERKDRIVHQNGITYEIPLYDASSGLQSVVPMMVLVEYLTTQYYADYRKELSYLSQTRKNELRLKLLKKHIPMLEQEDESRYLDRLMGQVTDPQKNETIKGLFERSDDLTTPSGISFILEEPEQNLYPDTQVEVLKSVISYCNSNNKNTAVVTTHSPYIVNYLNVLLKRALESPEKIRPEDLGVYLTFNGGVQNLMMHNQEKSQWAVDSAALSEAMNRMFDEYSNS